MSKIAMPEALKTKFRFTRDITGGPVFDFPAQGLKAVNLNELTERLAEQLVRRGWTGIAKVETPQRITNIAQPSAEPK